MKRKHEKLGLFMFPIPYDEVADIGYATIFPGMTIVKILVVGIVAALL